MHGDQKGTGRGRATGYFGWKFWTLQLQPMLDNDDDGIADEFQSNSADKKLMAKLI
ncbi:MAG: hypothetical protein H6611_05025 [Ignavibacteriales bacterium]|nr:hypothetical protein [Ignavibacteriales bacterium]